MYLRANICFTDFMMCCEKVEEKLTSCTVLPSIDKFQKFRNNADMYYFQTII